MTRVIKYCFKTRAIFLPSIQLFHKVIIVLFLRFVICQHINVARLNDSSWSRILRGPEFPRKFLQIRVNSRKRKRKREKEELKTSAM